MPRHVETCRGLPRRVAACRDTCRNTCRDPGRRSCQSTGRGTCHGTDSGTYGIIDATHSGTLAAGLAATPTPTLATTACHGCYRDRNSVSCRQSRRGCYRGFAAEVAACRVCHRHCRGPCHGKSHADTRGHNHDTIRESLSAVRLAATRPGISRHLSWAQPRMSRIMFIPA